MFYCVYFKETEKQIQQYNNNTKPQKKEKRKRKKEERKDILRTETKIKYRNDEKCNTLTSVEEKTGAIQIRHGGTSLNDIMTVAPFKIT